MLRREISQYLARLIASNLKQKIKEIQISTGRDDDNVCGRYSPGSNQTRMRYKDERIVQ